MAFITKNAINRTYNRCIEILDKFDSDQLAAIYDYICIFNQIYDNYEIGDEPNRVNILRYLIQLKNNDNDCDEHVLYNKISSINHVMIGMELLKQKYIANHAV